jgi:hypothetical protein
MSGLDLQASMSNLTQMDRHQQDAHRSPVAHQQQNAVQAQQDAMRRLAMPPPSDALEQKDPDSRRTKREYRFRKRRRQHARVARQRDSGGGGFVDYNA